jgi:hypothetical protein
VVLHDADGSLALQALLGTWLQEAEGSASELLSLLDVAADEGAFQGLRTCRMC